MNPTSEFLVVTQKLPVPVPVAYIWKKKKDLHAGVHATLATDLPLWQF
jgi:hypothetical protein